MRNGPKRNYDAALWVTCITKLCTCMDITPDMTLDAIATLTVITTEKSHNLLLVHKFVWITSDSNLVSPFWNINELSLPCILNGHYL